MLRPHPRSLQPDSLGVAAGISMFQSPQVISVCSQDTEPALGQLSSLLYQRRRRPGERLGPAQDDTANGKGCRAWARELPFFSQASGSRKWQGGLGWRPAGTQGSPGVPRTSQLLGRSPGCAPGNCYLCLQPSQVTRKRHQASLSHAGVQSRLAPHPQVGAQFPRGQGPPALWKLHLFPF